MRMLRWMSINTRKDTISIEYIEEKVRVAPIEEKMTESC